MTSLLPGLSPESFSLYYSSSNSEQRCETTMHHAVVIEGEEAGLAIEVIPEAFSQIRMLAEFLSANPFASAKAIWTATSINNLGDVGPGKRVLGHYRAFYRLRE